MHHGGEGVTLLEALCAEQRRKVGAECRYVGRSSREQHATDVSEVDSIAK